MISNIFRPNYQYSHDPNNPNQQWEFLELSWNQICHNYVRAFMNWPRSDPLSAFLALELTWFHSQVLSMLSHSFLIFLLIFPPAPYHPLTQYSLSVKNGSLNNLGRLHWYFGHKSVWILVWKSFHCSGVIQFKFRSNFLFLPTSSSLSCIKHSVLWYALRKNYGNIWWIFPKWQTPSLGPSR